jgi:hypothetical protein
MCGSESKHPETVDGNDADAGNSHDAKFELVATYEATKQLSKR